MKKGGVALRFCQTCCKYYKAGKNEDLFCMGYIVLRRLGMINTAVRQKPGLNHAAYDSELERLRKTLCPGCDFFTQDCDFISSGGGLAPCGGLLVLAALISSGRIEMVDIKTVKPDRVSEK